MKKISQIQWKRYKKVEGKKVIAKFEALQSDECTIEEMIELAKEYTPQFFKNISADEMQSWKDCFAMYDEQISVLCSDESIDFEKVEDYIIFYYILLHFNTTEDPGKEFEKIPQTAFKNILSDNIAMTTLLHAYFPQFFLPNFFVTQFLYLEKFAEKYEIELPPIPNRSDYRERCLYYLDICEILLDFAAENELGSTAELCTFIFDYEFPVIKEEIENEMLKDLPATAEQAWLLVGKYDEGERNMESGLWQANQMTCRGDIMMFYEKSPVKKMNAAWIALEDGRIDPFAFYYSYTYIGKKIEIPDDMAITFQEFKNCEYFKVENRGTKGNYVSKNFQDTSGWQITSDDFKEIKRMLEAKGYDVDKLPNLYIPEGLGEVDIKDEADVEEKLIVPTLRQMGWTSENGDYLRQVVLHLGREDKGRTDFSLFPFGENKKKAKVVIEAKYFIKDKSELDDALAQGVSYARLQEANLLLIIDKNSILIYEKTKNDYKRSMPPIRWTVLYNNEDGSQFVELKRMIESYK